MIKLKSKQQIGWIKEAGAILSEAIRAAKQIIEPGIKTSDLDMITRNIIKKRGAKAAFLGYQGYPAALCVSVNEEVIHGIPGSRKLEKGDLVGLDLGVSVNGLIADAAVTVAVGDIDTEAKKLLVECEKALYSAIDKCSAGGKLREVSRAIFNHGKKNNFGIVKDYCGHGVGFSVHEEPSVANYPSGRNITLPAGLVIAIEPMFTLGGGSVKLLEDGWTVVSKDSSLTAHFEHTVVINENGSEILTAGLCQETL